MLGRAHANEGCVGDLLVRVPRKMLPLTTHGRGRRCLARREADCYW